MRKREETSFADQRSSFRWETAFHKTIPSEQEDSKGSTAAAALLARDAAVHQDAGRETARELEKTPSSDDGGQERGRERMSRTFAC